MLYPDTTQEFESRYGRLEDQPQGSYIVGWSVEDEADWIEEHDIDQNTTKNEIVDEYTPIVRGEEE